LRAQRRRIDDDRLAGLERRVLVLVDQVDAYAGESVVREPLAFLGSDPHEPFMVAVTSASNTGTGWEVL